MKMITVPGKVASLSVRMTPVKAASEPTSTPTSTQPIELLFFDGTAWTNEISGLPTIRAQWLPVIVSYPQNQIISHTSVDWLIDVAEDSGVNEIPATSGKNCIVALIYFPYGWFGTFTVYCTIDNTIELSSTVNIGEILA